MFSSQTYSQKLYNISLVYQFETKFFKLILIKNMAEKNNNKKISFTENLVLTYRKLLSLIVFLFLFCLFLCVFYIIGNYKEFLDSSQKLILSWLSFASIVLGFFSFIGLAVNVILMIKKNKTKSRILSIFLMLFFLLFSIFANVFSYFVNYLSLGLVL